MMERKYKSLFKDTLIFAIGSLGSKLILFFLVPLYTNYLSTAEYGTADLVQSFSQLVIPFAALVINEAVIRFGMKKSEKPEKVLLSSVLVLIFSFASSFVICSALRLYNVLSDWWVYLYALVLLSNINEVEKTYLKVKDKNRAFAIISIIQTAVLATLNIIMLTVLHTGIRGYLLSTIIATGTGAVISFFVAGIYKDLRNSSFDKRLLVEMVKYSTPLIFSNVSWWIIHSSDKIMIELMIGASALGIYTAATKIPSLINIIIAIFNQAWGISSIKEIESTNDQSFYSDVFNLFTVVLFGAGILFTSIIKPFMGIYVGENFSESWVYTPLLLSAAVFFAIQAFIGSIYSALQRSINNMWTTILCVAINVIVNYIFIKLVGTWGAIIGTISSYFIIATVRIIDVKRYISFDVKIRQYVINVVLLLGQAIFISLNGSYLIVSIIAIAVFVINNREEEKRLCISTSQWLTRLLGRAKG